MVRATTYDDGELSILRHQVRELMGHPDHQHHWACATNSDERERGETKQQSLAGGGGEGGRTSNSVVGVEKVGGEVLGEEDQRLAENLVKQFFPRQNACPFMKECKAEAKKEHKN
jgi:hypothetical protein